MSKFLVILVGCLLIALQISLSCQNPLERNIRQVASEDENDYEEDDSDESNDGQGARDSVPVIDRQQGNVNQDDEDDSSSSSDSEEDEVIGNFGGNFNQPGTVFNRPGLPGQNFNQPGQNFNQPGQNFNQPGQNVNQPGTVFNRPGLPGQNFNQPGGSNRPSGNINQQPGGGQVSTTPAPTTAPTANPRCIQSCPGTPEYNPVCGSNRQSYTNIGRLECARRCGLNVQFVRNGNC